MALTGTFFHAQTRDVSEELLPKCEDDPLFSQRSQLSPFVCYNLIGRKMRRDSQGLRRTDSLQGLFFSLA